MDETDEALDPQNDPETPLEDLVAVELTEVDDPEVAPGPTAEWGQDGVGFDAEDAEPAESDGD